MLAVSRIDKHFGGIHAVRACSFTVRAGALTALIGPNGAGKTTALNIISGFEVAEQGSVVFGGEDITALPAHERARHGMSRTFQQVRLFRNMSVFDNCALAVRENDDSLWRQFFRATADDREKIALVFERIGARIPLEKNVNELSFGQRKLVELARALLMPHKMLFLDEPVAGIAPNLRGLIADILEGLRIDGETILFIEHDMDFVMRLADEVIVMDRGSVLVKGAPEAIRQDQRVLDAYLGFLV